MNPPMTFGEPVDARCSCPTPKQRLAAALEGYELPACEVHEPKAFAAAEAGRAREVANAQRDYWRARADIAQGVLTEQRSEMSDPTSLITTGDPMLDSLTAKVGRLPSTTPLNSPGITAAAASAVGGAGTADPRTPIDAPDR